MEKVRVAKKQLDLFSKGTKIWIEEPSSERVWMGAEVENFDLSITKEDDKVILEKLSRPKSEIDLKLDYIDEDGKRETRVVKMVLLNDVVQFKNLPLLRNPDILLGQNDLTMLSYLHEPGVLYNLKFRFLDRNCIYTYCGIILVAINPYTEMSNLYSNEVIQLYRNKLIGELEPHIFAIAENAYHKLEYENKNQSIIVSGESGAGKTVSAKYAMRYFASIGGSADNETQIERKVVNSSPIMEAIGNAKTIRNDNSSRFGKYIELYFSPEKNSTSLRIQSSSMSTYLLEKSRVVFQAENERNYHVFYQICAGRNTYSEVQDLFLNDNTCFNFTKQKVTLQTNDEKDFGELLNAMTKLDIGVDKRRIYFKLLASILHLGNVQFQSTNDSSTTIPKGDKNLKIFCDLLQLNEDEMRKWLTNRKITAHNEEYVKPMSLEEGKNCRDALAKLLYSESFNWVVAEVNKSLHQERSAGKSMMIGVLDIYGFETFENNSFEQFCINYANEKLQQQFNLHVFKLEQEEYFKEEIEWTFIEFYDNQPCIDLIENKLGILSLLDEECRMPKGNDQSFTTKLYDKCHQKDLTDPVFIKPKFFRDNFIVRHFADKVEYQSEGFLEKNRDTVLAEQIITISDSKIEWISKLLFEASQQHQQTISKAKGQSLGRSSATLVNRRTVGNKFRESLNLLMKSLNSTTPHYVRTIKPNDIKEPFNFDSQRAIQQLRACGVLETIRISSQGFPSRWTYPDFCSRYYRVLRYKIIKHLAGQKEPEYMKILTGKNKTFDFKKTSEMIIRVLIKDDDQFRLGKSKIFLRSGQVANLERFRQERIREAAVIVQRITRGYLVKKKYAAMKKSANLIQRYGRGLFGRRHFLFLRQTRAAIIIQKNFRRFKEERSYKLKMKMIVQLQSHIRGFKARLRYKSIKQLKAAVVIQKYARRFVQQKKFERQIKSVIIVQNLVRKFLAKRELKKLKKKASSIEHIKNLNKGLENKIISLQMKISDFENVKNESKKLHLENQNLKEKLNSMKDFSSKFDKEKQQNDVYLKEIEKLNSKIKILNDDNVDLANSNINKEEKLLELNEQLSNASSGKELLENSVKDLELKLTENEKLYKEFNQLKIEKEEDQMKYQKLLNNYHSSENKIILLEDQLKNGFTGDLSNYSSANSTLEKRPRSNINMGPGGDDVFENIDINNKENEDDENVILTLIELQKRLKKKEDEVERMNKTLEKYEMETPFGEMKRTQDLIRLQELEMENVKVKEDLKRLVEASISKRMDEEVLKQNEHLQEELYRKREESIQLRTVLATNYNFSSLSSKLNGDDETEIGLILTTQKLIIQQLESELQNEKLEKLALTGDMKNEIVNLRNDNDRQQKLLFSSIKKEVEDNINHNSASVLKEKELSHQVSRLITENLNMFKKNEQNMKEIQRLKEMLKRGDNNNNNGEENRFIGEDDHLKVKRLNVEYKGMLEYKGGEEKILKSLIMDLKPEIVLKSGLPSLPAYILFMLIRYTDYLNDDSKVRQLLNLTINNIKKLMRKKSINQGDHLELSVLWLSNVLRLLHTLKQYSGDSIFQTENSIQQNEQCLKNFDLSEYRQVLSDIAVWIFLIIIKQLEDSLQSLIVPAILESDSSGLSSSTGIFGSRTRLSSVNGINEEKPLETLRLKLNIIFNLLNNYGLDPEVVSQVFRQLYYFICAGAFNNLLLRKDLCHVSKGIQIRCNLTSLEEWCRNEKKFSGANEIIDTLQPLIQATQLLLCKKNSDPDAEILCEITHKLTLAQVVKLLQLYTPTDDFEDKVSVAFIKKVQAKLEERSKSTSSENTTTLLMDTKFSFAVKFPFNPSSIRLEDLQVPVDFGLQQIVKKI